MHMKDNETQTPTQKTWRSVWEKVKSEWLEVWDFDRRGIYLSGVLSLTSVVYLSVIWGQSRKLSPAQEVGQSAIFLFVFLISFLSAQILKHRYGGLVASAVAVGAGIVFFIAAAVAGADALVSAFPVTFTAFCFVTGVFAGADAGVNADLFAVIGSFAAVLGLASVIAFSGMISAIAVIVVIVVVIVVAQVILIFHQRAFRFFQRAQSFKAKELEHRLDDQETTTTRRVCRATLTKLQRQKRSLTLGLAGRRGLGKTALLRDVLQESDAAAPKQIQSDRDLKDGKKVKTERSRCLRLLVATPTEFVEQVFLMALLERLAQAFIQSLIRLLPSVQPFKVEQELREKRRLLRVSHMVMFSLTILNICMSLYFLNATTRTPVLRQFPFKPDSTITSIFLHPRIYRNMQDSLLTALRAQAAPLQDSLIQIDALLNPIQKEYMIQAIWDSLKKSRAWPKLDSLRRTSQLYQAILDSIKVVSSHYRAIADSVALRAGSPFAEEASREALSLWFWFNGILLLMLPFVYWRTREGEARFTKSVYSVVRNEIALYERTNSLLERLHFQMSFGESREAGLAFSRSGWQLARKISKQVQRQARPYTTMSLIDEFRDYIADAKMYLNDALQMSDPGTKERFRIIIAIDELDKILDTDKLHNMLKSMKAIFEMEDVYYILSISEDALETYRLRHVDTKNEIDSAFTHIIPVPPMDAIGSLAFYVEHHQSWVPELLPAAIVFGGGVPRDMHRLSQIFGTYPSDINLQQCIERLVKEDVSACEDMILLNSHLSDEGKQVWLKILTESGFTSKEKTEKLLGKIEAHAVDDFTKINPCGGDKAKEQFHRLRSLIRGVVIKGFIYHTVQSHPTPSILTSWPQASELRSFIEHLPEEASLESWLAQLEPLRDAIFELSRNPLRVWENLTKA